MDGLPEGMEVEYHASGQVASEVRWSAGVRSSAFAFYDEEGRRRTAGTHADDAVTGELRQFDEEGRLVSLEHYAHDVLEGAAFEYGADGALRVEGAYRAGERHGAWTYFAEDGTVERVETWVDGELQSEDGPAITPVR